MKMRVLGKNLKVSAVGLGCMGFSHAYGAPMEREETIRLLRRAADMGYTLSLIHICGVLHHLRGYWKFLVHGRHGGNCPDRRGRRPGNQSGHDGGSHPVSYTHLDATTLSREELTAVCRAVSIPVAAIGGITEENCLELAGTGVSGIAVVSALFAAADKEEAAARLRALAEKIAERS